MSKGEKNSRFFLAPILAPVDVTIVGPCLLVASNPVKMSLSQFLINFDLHKLKLSNKEAVGLDLSLVATCWAGHHP